MFLHGLAYSSSCQWTATQPSQLLVAYSVANFSARQCCPHRTEKLPWNTNACSYCAYTYIHSLVLEKYDTKILLLSFRQNIFIMLCHTTDLGRQKDGIRSPTNIGDILARPEPSVFFFLPLLLCNPQRLLHNYPSCSKLFPHLLHPMHTHTAM